MISGPRLKYIKVFGKRSVQRRSIYQVFKKYGRTMGKFTPFWKYGSTFRVLVYNDYQRIVKTFTVKTLEEIFDFNFKEVFRKYPLVTLSINHQLFFGKPMYINITKDNIKETLEFVNDIFK